MANKEKMRALVEKTYAARDRGDLEASLAGFHPDASFGLAGDPQALQLAGTVHGHADIRQSLGGFIEAFEFVSREILHFIADGNGAAVHSRLEIRFIPKNKTFSTEVLDVIEFQDDKIVRFVEFADTALIKDLIST